MFPEKAHERIYVSFYSERSFSYCDQASGISLDPAILRRDRTFRNFTADFRLNSTSNIFSSLSLSFFFPESISTVNWIARTICRLFCTSASLSAYSKGPLSATFMEQSTFSYRGAARYSVRKSTTRERTARLGKSRKA